VAEDVALGAAVEGDDVQAVAALLVAELPRPLVLVPRVRRVRFDGLDPVGAAHVAHVRRALDELRVVQQFGGQHTVHGAFNAELADQRAGVDPLDAHDVVLPQVLVEAHVGPVVRVDRRQLLHDESRDVRAAAFDVLAVDAVVADQRVGHRDDLPLVGRVGEDLLVAGHRGVEDDLALGRAVRPERAAGEDGPVLQRKLRHFALVAHRGGSIGGGRGERKSAADFVKLRTGVGRWMRLGCGSSTFMVEQPDSETGVTASTGLFLCAHFVAWASRPWIRRRRTRGRSRERNRGAIPPISPG
jgi:hypothetical protein